MDLELGRLRREAGGSLDQLAQYADVPLEELQEWERRDSVPGKYATQVKWGLWALRRDAALAKSGLPECQELAGFERKLSEKILEALRNHLAECELCKRRERYLEEVVGPMPPMRGGLFIRGMIFVGRLPQWQQSAVAGALLVLLMGGAGVVVFLGSALLNRDVMALATAGGLLVLLLGSGAAGGIVYHVTGPIRARGSVGHYVSSVITMYAYLATVLGVVALAALFVGWEAIGPEMAEMVTTPYGLVLWLVIGGVFGVILGRALRQK